MSSNPRPMPPQGRPPPSISVRPLQPQISRPPARPPPGTPMSTNPIMTSQSSAKTNRSNESVSASPMTTTGITSDRPISSKITGILFPLSVT